MNNIEKLEKRLNDAFVRYAMYRRDFDYGKVIAYSQALEYINPLHSHMNVLNALEAVITSYI